MQNDGNDLSTFGLPYHETEDERKHREDIETTRKKLNDALEQLKSFKTMLNDNPELVDLDNRLKELQEEVDENVSEISKLKNDIEKKLSKLNKEINKISKQNDKTKEELKKLVDEQETMLESSELLSEEELTRIREEFNEQKMTLQAKIEDNSRMISSLKSGVKVLKTKFNNLTIAESLGLTLEEYTEIFEVVSNRKYQKILIGIYTKFGLGDIATKYKKDLTKEELEKIEFAKKEAIKQIAEFRRNEHREESILDSIRALYSLDIQMKKDGTVRTVSLNGEEIKRVKANAAKLPASVKGFERPSDLDYVPDISPSDMLGVSIVEPDKTVKKSDSEKSKQLVLTGDKSSSLESRDSIDLTVEQIRKKFDDVMSYKKQQDYMNDLIWSEYNKQAGLVEDMVPDNDKDDAVIKNEVSSVTEDNDAVADETIDNASESSKNLIIENEDKKADSNVTETNVESDELVDKNNNERGYVMMTPDEILQARYNINHDKNGNSYDDYVERVRSAIADFIEKHPEEAMGREGESKLAAVKRVADMIYDETGLDFRIDIPDEYIPGTNVLKPRSRDPYETDEEYVEFLKEYYDEFLTKKDEVEEFVSTDNSEEVLESNSVNIDQPIVDDLRDAETVTLFVNEDKDEFYVRSYTAGRYELHSASNPARIGGALCYRISRDDMERLVSGANDIDSVSPYRIVTQTYHRANDNSIALGESNTSEEELNNQTSSDITEDVSNTNDSNEETNDNALASDEPLRIGMNGDEPSRIGMNDDEPSRIGMNGDEPLRIGMNDDEPLRIGMKDENLQIPMKDTVILYHETNSGDFYANQETIDRFGLASANSEVINGDEYFRIPNDQAEALIASANGDEVVDYHVVVRDFELENQNNRTPDPIPNPTPNPNPDPTPNPNPDPTPNPDPDPNPVKGDDEETEKVILYREVNDNSIYVTEDILNVFGINGIDSPVEYNGMELFHISDEDHENIKHIAEVSKDPKLEIEYQDINLKTKDKPVTDEVEVIELNLFRDLDDNNQVYVPESVLNIFGISSLDYPTIINGIPSFKVRPDIDEKINLLAEKSVDPKYVVKYTDVHLKKKEDEEENKKDDGPKKPRPHVESILQKLTEGLVIKPKDGKRFMASNIHVAKKFKNELNSGNYLYNLVSFFGKVVSLPVNLFRKATSKLLLGVRGKRVMNELNSRLDDLSEEELEVLFEEYRGSQLKTDMNNQINPLILERLRKYGMEKVTKLNNSIKENYQKLFILVGQIDAIDEQLANGKLSDEQRNTLLESRADLVGQAATCIRGIEEDRIKANNLLSGGIHGLEEDFKAVSTKLSYVGMRFAKTNKFDNELQARLAKYGQGLRDAMANDDDEAILDNFMSLESEYSKNTKIRKISLTGSKSVGSKYYTPLAERFDYRDDPFIKDLFTTVAVASSIYSAINAYRVHQIESQQIVQQQNSTAARVNQQNDATISQAHQIGTDIQSKEQSFREGLAAEAHAHDLNTSGVYERGNLDANNWTFNDPYHAADAQAHIDYNAMHDQTVQGIQSTISGYSSGALTQTQALQDMVDVANSAYQNLVATVSNYQQICQSYAATHPQFDLHAFTESMDYLVQHSSAITNMNQSMVDVISQAELLQSLSSTHMSTLASLPSDMYTTLMANFATCCYAGYIMSNMKRGYGKNKYGNDITSMMEEYASSHAEEDTTSRTR